MYKYDHLIKKIKEIDSTFPLNKKINKKILKFNENKNYKEPIKVKLDKAI